MSKLDGGDIVCALEAVCLPISYGIISRFIHLTGAVKAAKLLCRL